MRAKKLTTEDGDEVLVVLKGAKHVTSSLAATQPQFMALTAASPRNWATADSNIGVSAKSFNSENRSLMLDEKHSKSCRQEGQSICGNSGFLRRVIEFRIKDSNFPVKMASGNENSGEEPSSMDKRETRLSLKCSVSEDQPAVESSAAGAVSVSSEMPLPDHLDKRSMEAADTLSHSGTDKEGNDLQMQNEEFSPKQCEENTGRNRVIGDIIRHVLPKIPTIRRVEELRIRIESNVENADSVKELCKIGNPVVKNHTSEKCAIKYAAEVKEDSSKVEVRRSNSSARENPPRKVSFKVRSGSNNGRLSSSYISSTASRRSSALSKASLADSRISSKVAVLASKFNAIIHENKEGKSLEIIQDDSDKVLMISQFSAGPITITNKKQPQTEKTFVTRRNSSNSKRESCLSNSGESAKNASLGVALRKHASTTQPLLESDNSHKSSNSSITKDCKRRSNMSCRPPAVGAKSGSVKAAIQIFEKNATTTHSAKDFAVASAGNRRNLRNAMACESKQSPESAEAKKEPKYPRVIFKRGATLVRVTLDCEDVCNEDQTARQVEDNYNTQTNHCQKSLLKLSPCSSEGEEKVCVNNGEYVESYNAQCKSDKSITVLTVGGGAGQEEIEQKQAKTKPAVPVKNVTKGQVFKSVPLCKKDTKDSNYVKVTCKPESVFKTTDNESATKTTSVHYDKLAFLRKAPAGSESSINKILSTLERENLQETDREPMTPNTSFLWGVLPPSNKVVTQNNQSTSVPLPITENNEPTNQEDPATETNDSIDDTYDDVYPPSTVYCDGVSSIHPYSVVHPQEDDEVYDDVGPPVREEKQSPTIHTLVATSADGNGTDGGYDYCSGPMEPSLDQNYDDCEGEGYQCIGEDSPHEDTESNIYDDVKSVTTLRISEDVASVSNCYESIYAGGPRPMASDGTPTNDGGAMRTGGPSSASSSIGSGNHSFCDKSNSLYGVGGSRFDSASVSQASTVSAEDGPHEVLSYQLTCLGPRQPRSETSDEWVDIEMTDSDGEGSEDAVAVYQGHTRSWRSPRRSQKVRKQWTKSPRKATGNLISDP